MKGIFIKEVIESAGAVPLKLLPYSTDLNPIEHAWANLKHAVKSAEKSFDDFAENLAEQLNKMNRFKTD
ncbi:MAG: hypothetical protein ABW189_03980 [Rickettsiales bacterium]